MKSGKILITGAGGNLGGRLVKELADYDNYEVIAVSPQDEMKGMLEREHIENTSRINIVEPEEFISSNLKDCDVSAAIHMAFSRADKLCSDIANSLDYSLRAYRRLYEMKVPRIVYISSQSVYGKTPEWRTEELEPSPQTVYSMAKYAGEKLLEAQFNSSGIQYTTLRLDYVIQSQKLVPALCKSAKYNGTINLQGGKQVFSYIDRTDVAKAIVSLLKYDGEWKRVYNVGPNRMRLSLMDVAEVVRCISERNGTPKTDIKLEENDTELWSGMDSSLFMKDTGWHPEKDIGQMIEDIFREV